MSSAYSEIECPNCEYMEASRDLNCRSRSEHIICFRCGYMEDHSINFERSKLPDHVFWETEIINGKGSYIYSMKESNGSAIGSVLDDTISKLKDQLDKFTVCKYTFQKNGEWFIKDLLKDTETLFTTSRFQEEDDGKSHERTKGEIECINSRAEILDV